MTEREQILKLLKANAGTITDNIAEFLIRNVEDLISAGVDERVIADAAANTSTILPSALYFNAR